MTASRPQSGALGDVLDCVAQGAVTDFVDIHHAGRRGPTFMADVAIVCGVALLVIGGLRREEEARTSRPPEHVHARHESDVKGSRI